jgi:undecaprenyl diphosphate synthase
MQARNPLAQPGVVLPDVDPARIPRHVAIIMDGNGRWAIARDLPREMGHQAGAARVREVVGACGKAGVEVLTLYSFSSENWKRPKDEVDALMRLAVAYLEGEREELLRKGVRLRIVGSREGLPADVLNAMDRVTADTAHCRAMTLVLAINYGSRAEIAAAARSLARDAVSGRLRPEEIDESCFAKRLLTSDLPDPDLLVRTASEMRLSNFLLWQVSYAEIVVTPTLWPDFGEAEMFAAIREFAGRNRTYGARPHAEAAGG